MAKEYVVFHGPVAVAGVSTLEEANKILTRYSYNGHIEVAQCFRYSPRNINVAGFTSGNTQSDEILPCDSCVSTEDSINKGIPGCKKCPL